MMIIGVILLSAAVAAATVLITQNADTRVDVDWLGRTWHVQEGWLVVAGIVIAAVGFAGLAMMRRGGARYWRMRREHRALVRDHERLTDTYEAEREHTAREETAREQTAAHEQAAHEQAAREQAAREQAARERAAREQATRERATRDQTVARDQAAGRDQTARHGRSEAAGTR